MRMRMNSVWAKIMMKLFGSGHKRGEVGGVEATESEIILLKNSHSCSFLPEEIIVDMILSRLPVKSLLRFKCVCKYWNFITLLPRFVVLHSKLSQPKIIFDNPGGGRRPDYFVVTTEAGLLLEQTNYTARLRLQIKNPEMRKILHLPNPPRETPILYFDIIVFPSSHDHDYPVFKLISVHEDGYEVLDLGNYDETRRSYSWRPLNVPHAISSAHKKNIQFLIIDGIGYCIWETGPRYDPDIKVDILDIRNESYIGNTTCPHRGFFSRNYMCCSYPQLSFAQIVVKDSHELHISVLDDYKSKKWSDTKQVIKLSSHFLKTIGGQLRDEDIYLCWASQYEVVFFWRSGQLRCTYNINTGQVISDQQYCLLLPMTTKIKPSLFTFKGMFTQS